MKYVKDRIGNHIEGQNPEIFIFKNDFAIAQNKKIRMDGIVRSFLFEAHNDILQGDLDNGVQSFLKAIEQMRPENTLSSDYNQYEDIINRIYSWVEREREQIKIDKNIKTELLFLKVYADLDEKHLKKELMILSTKIDVIKKPNQRDMLEFQHLFSILQQLSSEMSQFLSKQADTIMTISRDI